MSFDLAFLKSDKRVIVKDFSRPEEKGRWMDLQEITSCAPSALLYTENALADGVKNLLTEESRHYPVRRAEDFELDEQQFENLSADEARKLNDKVSASWILQNNLNLLSELFKVRKHLKELWPNDRTSFFEELWFILKTNLNARELKIVYNHLQKGEEGQKNKLIRSKVEGMRNPEPQPGGEFEEKLLTHYEDEFQHNFSISEYEAKKGELVITATINQSPIVIMAKTPQLTKLQESLLSAFFDGLQDGS